MDTLFDVKGFGEAMKNVRKSVGHSQLFVSTHTNISIDTLRKIENGYVIPRFDTLTLLGMFYNRDLHNLYKQHWASYPMYEYYDQLDEFISQEDFEKLRLKFPALKRKLKALEDSHFLKGVEYKKIDLFLKGTGELFDEKKEQAKAYYIASLSIDKEGFSLESLKKHTYNYFDIRVMVSLGNVLSQMKDYRKSIEILEFAIGLLGKIRLGHYGENLLKTRAYAYLTYNAFRMEDDLETIAYAQMGIDHCLEIDSMAFLHFLLFRKGIAMYYLGQEHYAAPIMQALSLLRIQKNEMTRQAYTRSLRDTYKLQVDEEGASIHTIDPEKHS